MKNALHHVPWQHLLGAAVFCVVCALAWFLPVVIMGFPLEIPDLDAAKEFAVSGIVPVGDGRYSVLILSLLAERIPWTDIVTWSAVSAVSLSIAFFLFWILSARLYGAVVAWGALVVTGLMPVYWQQGATLTRYVFAFIPLFLCFLTFLELKDRHRWAALIVSGVFFGLVIGFKDTFIVFLPWFALAYLWTHRGDRFKRALVEIAVFFAVLLAVYSLPLVPNAMKPGLSVTDRIASVLPFQRALPSVEEFYGDLYTYEFDREWYEAEALKRIEEAPNLVEGMRYYHRLISFGVGPGGILRSLWSGFWLFLNAIPHYVFPETVGGAFLWVFIIFGGLSLVHENRRLLWYLLGLVITVEFFVRFGFHFQRIHLMNHGWVLAFIAGIGIFEIATLFGKRWKGVGVPRVLWILLILTALQLLQANRSWLAREYRRSGVPQTVAVARVIAGVPPDSIVALPISDGIGLLSDRNVFFIRNESLERMLEAGKTREAVDHYGITHLMGYDEDLMERARRSVPSLKVLTMPPPLTSSVSDTFNYFLHLFR